MHCFQRYTPTRTSIARVDRSTNVSVRRAVVVGHPVVVDIAEVGGRTSHRRATPPVVVTTSDVFTETNLLSNYF